MARVAFDVKAIQLVSQDQEDIKEEQAQCCAVEHSVGVPVPQIVETGRSKRVSEEI